MSKSLQARLGPQAAPRGVPVRSTLAAVLRGASWQLVRLARKLRVAPAATGTRRVPEFEFYAEAGAPEGALYLDGELVGYLPGGQRL